MDELHLPEACLKNRLMLALRTIQGVQLAGIEKTVLRFFHSMKSRKIILHSQGKRGKLLFK